jgi:hypothetical protein
MGFQGAKEMTGNTFRGLLVLGALAAALALSGSAAAQEADQAHQPRAQQALAKAQAAREVVTKAQAEGAPAPSIRQQHLLDKADLELRRASQYYASGRYRDAARVAEHVSVLVARASGPDRHAHAREVK